MIPESRSLYDVASKFLVLLMSKLVLHRLSGDTGFELGTQMPSFAFTHLVLFRVGRPQKPALFINKSLAPFRGATSDVVDMTRVLADFAATR